MENDFFKANTELQAPSKIIRDDILFILDVVHKNRQYINKHFQNSMSNYFLRNFLFTLLAPMKKYQDENKMNMAITFKYKNTEGANYMRLINGYVKEIIRYDLLSQYRSMLSEVILKKNIEYSHDQLKASNDLQAQAWRKGFCLFLLYHSYQRQIKGIFEIWSSLFPEAQIVRLRKENTNHKIFIPDWTHKGAQGIECLSDCDDEQLNSRQENDAQREKSENKSPSYQNKQELNSEENDAKIERSEESSSSNQYKEELNSGQNEQRVGHRGESLSDEDQKELNQGQNELQNVPACDEKELYLSQEANQRVQQSIENPSNQIQLEFNSRQKQLFGKNIIENPFIQQEGGLKIKQNQIFRPQQGIHDSIKQDEQDFQSKYHEYYDLHSNIAQPSAQIYPENCSFNNEESIEQEQLQYSLSSPLFEKRLFDNNISELSIKKTLSEPTITNKNSTSNRSFKRQQEAKNRKIRNFMNSNDKTKGIAKNKSSKRNKSNQYHYSQKMQINEDTSQLKRCEVQEINKCIQSPDKYESQKSIILRIETKKLSFEGEQKGNFKN